MPPKSASGVRSEDLQVDARRAVLHVPDVELDPVGPRQLRAAVDLRPAGQAGTDREALALSLGVALYLVAEGRPRPDHRHLAADDVPELRQLVDRRSSKQAPDPSDARVAAIDREAGALLLRVDDHRAELQELEVDAVLADAGLPEEDRATVLELHGERGRGEERARDDEAEPRERDVRDAVHRVAAGSQAACTPCRR